MKKICLILSILTISLTSVFAKAALQSGESWMILQRAEQEFDNNNFSEAMRYAQDAVAKRKHESESESKILTNAVTPYQVRRVGDLIPDVLKVLEERQEYSAMDIIKKWTGKYGNEYFEDSLAKLREFINSRKDYPEAYILIAKIYRIEGEFSMAQDYLEKARTTSSLLEVPEMENDILFIIADIAEYTHDVPTQEKALLLIAKNSGDFSNETLKQALIRTSKSKKEDNSSKFFKMYRINSIACLNAYYKLSKIYDSSKKYEEAYITNLYGVLIAFTHLNSLLEERESDYQFTDLKTFFKTVSRYSDMVKWCNDNSFWEGFYNIYAYGTKCGYQRFPKDVIIVMSNSCPELYWKNAAQKCVEEAGLSK